MHLVEAFRSRARANKVLFLLTAILFLTFLDTTIMSVAAVDLQGTLHTSVSDLQWIINGYALMFAALMLAFGTLGDRLGRKRVMLGGVVVFIAGSVFGALAPNTWALVAARGIMGIGAAACEPGTLSVLRQIYPERGARARAIGWWAAMAGLALAMGPVIGGILVGLGGWRAIFWFNLAAGLAVFLAAKAIIPESADPEEGRTDWIGYVLGPVALATIVFAIIIGETAGYFSGKVLTLFAVGVVALALFIFAETKVKSPMLEVKYFRRAPFSGSLVVAFATYFGVFSIFFLTAIYLQVVLHYSAFRLATLFIPMALGMIIASSFAGRWVAERGARTPVTFGCLVAGTGVLLTDWSLVGEGHFAPLVLALTFAGVGFGVAVVPITTVALSALPARHSGMAASVTTTTREVGTVIGVAALGSLFSGRLTSFLTQRLVKLGWPPDTRETIISGVLTGKVPDDFTPYLAVIKHPTMQVAADVALTFPKGPQRDAAQQIAEGIVQATQAAFDAVHNGVSWSLLVAGCVILASGVVAFFTFPRTS